MGFFIVSFRSFFFKSKYAFSKIIPYLPRVASKTKNIIGSYCNSERIHFFFFFKLIRTEVMCKNDTLLCEYLFLEFVNVNIVLHYNL